MLSRRLLLLAVFAGGLFAAAPHAARADAGYEPAKDFVNNLSTQAIEVLTAQGVTEVERTDRFRKLFIGSVDLPVIGKLVMARYWRVATPDQQQEFLKLFEDMLVLTWSSRFKDAAGHVTFQVVDAKADVDQGVMVESRILRERQEAIPLIWRLRQPEGGYRIIDLYVEGTSMIFTYREEYSSVITQNGGKVESLLEALRKKVAQLSEAQGLSQN